MSDDRGGIVDRLRSLLGRRRKAVVPPGRAVFTASDLPASLVPPEAETGRDEPARVEVAPDEPDWDAPFEDEPAPAAEVAAEPVSEDAGEVADEPSEPVAEAGPADDVIAETASGTTSFLDLDVDLDLDALYEGLDPTGPSTPEPLFAGRSPAAARAADRVEPVEEEPTTGDEPEALEDPADLEPRPPLEPDRVVLDEEDDHRTLRDLADELARLVDREAPETSPAIEEADAAEVQEAPPAAPAAAATTDPAPADAPVKQRAEDAGLFDDHPRSDPGPHSRHAHVHDERLERRSAPIRLTPSEAVRLAEDGPNALRRRARPAEER